MPNQLLVTSTGYGPKGSTKRMQVLIKRTFFDFTYNSVNVNNAMNTLGNRVLGFVEN